MSTVIIVNDFVKNSHWTWCYNEDSFPLVEENWQKEDRLLVDLSTTKLFLGRKTWNSLKPIHYNLLITRNFVHMDALSNTEQSDPTNEVMVSLYFLLGSLTKSIGDSIDANVDVLKVRRIDLETVHFDFSASLMLDLNQVSSSPFKIVVDNT